MHELFRVELMIKSKETGSPLNEKDTMEVNISIHTNTPVIVTLSIIFII